MVGARTCDIWSVCLSISSEVGLFLATLPAGMFFLRHGSLSGTMKWFVVWGFHGSEFIAHIFGWFLDRELVFSFVCRCVAAFGICMATASPVASSGRRTYVRWMVPWKHESCILKPSLWITCNVLRPVSEIWAVHNGCPSDHISPTPRVYYEPAICRVFRLLAWYLPAKDEIHRPNRPTTETMSFAYEGIPSHELNALIWRVKIQWNWKRRPALVHCESPSNDLANVMSSWWLLLASCQAIPQSLGRGSWSDRDGVVWRSAWQYEISK